MKKKARELYTKFQLLDKITDYFHHLYQHFLNCFYIDLLAIPGVSKLSGLRE